MLRHLEIPAALPVFLGGLRVGATLSVIGAIVGEFVSADRGLGFLINVGRGQFDTALVFVAVFTLITLAVCLYGVVVLLERRLDNTVYRLGFANSRDQARQLVRHGHILVNGRRVDIPSYLLRPGDAVAVAEKSRTVSVINEALEAVPRRGLPPWLELEKAKYEGVFKAYPSRDDMTLPVQEQLVVEFYSK